MGKILTLLLSLISSLVITHQSVLSGPTALKYLGYYAGDMDGPGAFADYTDEIAPFTNLLYIDHYFTANPLLATQRARDKGMKVVYRISDCLFITAHPYVYNPALWAPCIPSIQSVVNTGSVAAFYIMDEPYGNGIPKNDLEAAITVVRNQFPSIPTLVLEEPGCVQGIAWPVSCSASRPKFAPPANVQWYGLDCYPRGTGYITPDTAVSEVDFCKARYQQLKAIYTGYFVAVPDVYDHGDATRFAPIAAVQQEWYQYVQSDPQFIAILPFLYPDFTDSGFSFKGARSFPDVIAAHKDIGRQIMCASDTQEAVCGSNGTTYASPDLLKCDALTNTTSTTLAHYGACSTSVLGDANGDGYVNILDFNMVVSHFGQTGAAIAGDINNDGIVNILDFNMVISHFGQ